MTDLELEDFYYHMDGYNWVRVKANDYAYDGYLVAAFHKRSDTLRCVVEDDNGRLFIHNASQIERR